MSEKESKKKKLTFGKKDKDEKDTEVKIPPKYEFNLDDGFSHHDVFGLVLGILYFFWGLFKIIIWPIVWMLDENKKMYNFVRASSHDTPMTKDEREFFESLPLIFTGTGLVGGILIGAIAALGISEEFQAFLENLDLWQGIQDFFGFLTMILQFIVDVILWILNGIWWIISSLVSGIGSLISANAFLALFILVLGGLVFFVVVLLFRESGAYLRVRRSIANVVNTIIGSPDIFRGKVASAYRKFNHRFTSIFVGEERILTRTQTFFKSVVLYTVFMSLWTLIGGIGIAFQYGIDDTFSEVQTISFFAFVLFLSGFISGVFVLAFFARLLDSVARTKYLAEKEKAEDLQASEAEETEETE